MRRGIEKLTSCVASAALALALVPAIPLQVAHAAPDGVWDGATLTEPALEGGSYQIGTGAELAWFAAQVNDGVGAKYNAVLTDDIDLGNMEWTPIGNSTSKTFSGNFNGQGHRVEGLSCHITSWAPAGLFGIAKDASIRGVVVSGDVSAADFYAVGGIAARIEKSTTIADCGNEARVENKSNSGRAAGIVGWDYGTGSITGCYNRGNISGKAKSAGIVADTEYGVSVSTCYNTGQVSGQTAYAIASATMVSNAYSTGVATGTSKSYVVGLGSYEDVYYLDGTAADAAPDDDLVCLTVAQMKAAGFATTLGSAFKLDVGGVVNGGYPLLAWEKVPEVHDATLDVPGNLVWAPAPESDLEGIDIVCGSNAVSWDSVMGASAYRVRLYAADDTEHALVDEQTVETTYDFFDAFCGLALQGSANYVFTVTALGDGDSYLDSDESGPSEPYYLDAESFLATPENLLWNEASKIGTFSAVTGADFYIVALYRGDAKRVEYKLTRDLISESGGKISVYFINQLSAPGEYTFTVRAAKQAADGPNAGKIIGSALAKSAAQHFEPADGEAIKINSASDWMDIVNTTCANSSYATDADAQNALWSKRFELAADIDFSHLSSQEQVQTKSWGNIDAPFNGHLDGKGHKVTGLTLSAGDAGLFAYIGQFGVVENLVIDSPNVLFSDNAAVLCHYNYGTIKNSGVVNANITADSGAVIGGLVSRNMRTGLVECCYVQAGTMTTNSGSANGHGGFVGNNSGTIKRCWTSMALESKSYNEGGFCGWADEVYDKDTGEYFGAVFEDCCALGNVSAVKGWSGGFVGRVNSRRATFMNCYAANQVTSAERPGRAYGFFGCFGSEGLNDVNNHEGGGFNIVLPAENVVNCHYASTLTVRDRSDDAESGQAIPQVAGHELSAMQTSEFAQTLGARWAHDASVNGGLPYLDGVTEPQAPEQKDITVELAVALFDTADYTFRQQGQTISVTVPSTGNTRVIDVMKAAQEQGLLSYTYTVTSAYGSFIEEIDGHALASPDGWMFTVNDELSSVGVQLASVSDGDQILWYEGTTKNLFAPPAWADVTGTPARVEWIDIATAQELAALCADGADMTKNYRLTTDIDMTGVDFSGIGTGETPFAGTFDGAGHVVSNVTIALPNERNVGFFRVVRGAKIVNLNLRDVDVTGLFTVGGMVGRAAVELDVSERANQTGNQIGNCTVTGSVTAVNRDNSAASDGAWAGGFIGFNDGDTDDKTKISVMSSVDNCTAAVTVTAQAIYAGGFAGGNFGYLTNCAARGAVSGANCVGGFAGGNQTNIYDSHATGAVTGNDHVGGFAGSTYTAIERCYCTGDVQGYGSNVGGFAGTGGGALKDCSSAGTLTMAAEGQYAGGFAGHYTGSFAGLDWQITFSNNHGWCVDADGSTLKAIGNHGTSTVQAEQAVLSATQVTDWAALQAAFLEKHAVELDENGRVLPAKRSVDFDALGTAICEKLAALEGADANTAWVLADLAAYERAHGTGAQASDAAKQAFVDYVADALQQRGKTGARTATAGDIAKYIIGLRAIGADPRTIVLSGEDASTALDAVAQLNDKAADGAASKLDVNAQAFVLLALSLDDGYTNADTRAALVDTLLAQQGDDGLWGSADSTGFVLQALSSYRNTRADVAAAIERATAAETIEGLMDERGSAVYLGSASAESTAQLIAGLAACGKNPGAYTSATGRTLRDGLAQFVNADATGFVHDYAATGNAAIATEQGLRALIALKRANAGEEGALYDFSDVPAAPAVSTHARADAMTAEELATAKKAAIGQLQALADAQVFRPEQQAELAQALEAAYAAIAAAADGEAIEAALKTARQRVAAIPTADELSAQEVAAVRSLINAIGSVEADASGDVPVAVKAAIALARAGYDALADAQKAKVANIGALQTAEELLADIEAQAAARKAQQKAAADVDAITPADATADASCEVPALKVDAKSMTFGGSVKKKTLKVSFKAAKGALNYRIAYRVAGASTWSYAWSGGKTSVMLKGLKKGTLVQCRMAAYAKTGGTWVRSAWSSVTGAWMQTATVKLKAGKNKITAKVKKVKRVSAYRLSWSYKKNMKAAKTLRVKKSGKATLKKLKSKKRVYVQVAPQRAYQGTVYSGLSSAKKSVKVK